MASELVEKVKESRWMKDGQQMTTFYVTLVDGTGQREVPCYAAEGRDLKEDAPLPDGWEVKTSQKGKLYLAAPKSMGGSGGGGGGFKSSWANSEAGEKYVQERMDRRTALMQVLAYWDTEGTDKPSIYAIPEQADSLYTWLRKNLDVSVPRRTDEGGNEAVAVPQKERSGEAVKTARVGADTPLDGGGESSIGEAPPSPSINTCHCGKEWGPNTTSTGKRVCVSGHVERFDG